MKINKENMKIKDVISGKIDFSKLDHIGSGANASVYNTENENFVLRWSYSADDAFRYIANLKEKERDKFGFQPIFHKKKYGTDVLYLLEKLYTIDFSNEELALLDILNLPEHSIENAIENSLIDKIKMNGIVKLVDNLCYSLSGIRYELDIKPENIMQDKNGKIYLTDPISFIDEEE